MIQMSLKNIEFKNYKAGIKQKNVQKYESFNRNVKEPHINKRRSTVQPMMENGFMIDSNRKLSRKT